MAQVGGGGLRGFYEYGELLVELFKELFLFWLRFSAGFLEGKLQIQSIELFKQGVEFIKVFSLEFLVEGFSVGYDCESE